MDSLEQVEFQTDHLDYIALHGCDVRHKTSDTSPSHFSH